MIEIVDAVGPWWPIWALIVIVLGVGRLARVVVFDSFPPAAWLRQQWTSWTVKHKHEDWTILFFCWWCFTPWLMAVALGWFALTFVAAWIAWTWWIFWGWLAISYLASMVIARDTPQDGEK